MTVDFSTVEMVTRLVEQFGPFAFAVLFIFVVTRTARGYYLECMTRKHPPPTQQEQATYRLYFLCSIWVGIAVMTLSIGWWFYVQSKGNHVFQVAIVDLQPDETIVADYYNKKVPRPSIPGAAGGHDTLFLVVRDQPFKVGERFEFEYFKIPSDPSAVGRGIRGRRVEIKYAGNRVETYRLIDDATGTRLQATAYNENQVTAFTNGEIAAAAKRYASAAPLDGRTEP